MKINIMLKKVFLAIFLSASASAFAHNYEVSANTSIVGMDDVFKIPKVQEGEKAWTLEDVASKYKIGLSNMIEANVGIDPIVPHPEIEVIVPNRTILPNTKREGIVINSPEMRLYYYHDNTVDVLPIGIGDLGTDTPLNWVTKVERKKEGPTWTPTAKMHAEYRARGEYFLPYDLQVLIIQWVYLLYILEDYMQFMVQMLISVSAFVCPMVVLD